MPEKIVIYIDFWNLQLSWIAYHKLTSPGQKIKIPFGDKFSHLIASKADSAGNYRSTRVYASVDLNSGRDVTLNYYLKEVMRRFPNYYVDIKNRKERHPLKCPNEKCGIEITKCPSCNYPLSRTQEKAVDTALSVDLLMGAIDKCYTKSILISGDSDYIPAIEKIKRRGAQVTHVGFKGKAEAIRNSCSSHIYLDEIMSEILAI